MLCVLRLELWSFRLILFFLFFVQLLTCACLFSEHRRSVERVLLRRVDVPLVLPLQRGGFLSSAFLRFPHRSGAGQGRRGLRVKSSEVRAARALFLVDPAVEGEVGGSVGLVHLEHGPAF